MDGNGHARRDFSQCPRQLSRGGQLLYFCGWSRGNAQVDGFSSDRSLPTKCKGIPGHSLAWKRTQLVGPKVFGLALVCVALNLGDFTERQFPPFLLSLDHPATVPQVSQPAVSPAALRDQSADRENGWGAGGSCDLRGSWRCGVPQERIVKL